MQRFFDLILSSLAILCLLPLLLPVMLLLKLTGEHDIFYLQQRIGLGGKPFKVVKFATMLRVSPSLPGGYLTRKEDPRVLPVGKILRRWKINELPQLLNVWLGQMSFVGPRPQARVHYDLFDAQQKRAIDRQRPGLTGLGSLVFRNEEGLLERLAGDAEYNHDHVITPYKGQLETWYAENGTIGVYWKMILLTVLSLIRPDLNCLKFFPDAPRPAGALGLVFGVEESSPTTPISAAKG